MINIKGEKVRVEHEIVISEQQYKKLLSDRATITIGNLEADLQISTYAKKKGTSYVSIAWISPTSVDIDSSLFHELEIRHTSFLSAIDKWEPECPKNEDDDRANPESSEQQEEIDFVKQLLEDINRNKDDEDRVIGGDIMCAGPKYIPFVIPWGKISPTLLKKMCELYLENNE